MNRESSKLEVRSSKELSLKLEAGSWKEIFPLRASKRGQVGIETTVAMIAVFIFLLGATQVFLWMNRNIIERQRNYQNSRPQLTEAATIDFYSPQRLYVFPQEKPGDTGGR